MSRATELSQFPMSQLAQPVLVECDMQGRVLWMSDAAKARLGEAENLARAVLAQPATASSPAFSRLARILQIKNSVIVSIQPIPPEVPSRSGGLHELEHGLLLHYFHLQKVERSLSSRTRSRPRRSGARTVRQLEMERRRLGRELHTGVGQLLAAIRLQLEVVAQQLPQAPAGVEQALDRISRLASDALDQVRSISGRLHPPEWQRLGIDEALSQLWELSGIPQRFDAHLRIESPAHEPDLEVKVLLYRGAQEGISNFVRHAAATRIEMTLESGPAMLRLTIRDNGAGFDPAALSAGRANVAAGLGLRSIREQAESVGGKLEIESGPAGTTLRVSTPYSASGG